MTQTIPWQLVKALGTNNCKKDYVAFFLIDFKNPDLFGKHKFNFTNNMKLKILFIAFLALVFNWATAQTIEQGRTIGGSAADGNIRTVKVGDFIYMLGETGSPNFPSTDGSVFNPGGGSSRNDITITKIDGLTGNILFSKIIGGNGGDYAEDMKVVNNTIHIVGRTASSDFPVTNGSTLSGSLDVVYLKLNAVTGATIFSGYYGGSNGEIASRLEVEGNTVHIVGSTLSADFPVTNGSTFKGGDRDIFYLQLNHTTGAINVASFIGGSGVEEVRFIDVVGTDVFVGGNTRSTDFPVTDGSTLIQGFPFKILFMSN